MKKTTAFLLVTLIMSIIMSSTVFAAETSSDKNENPTNSTEKTLQDDDSEARIADLEKQIEELQKHIEELETENSDLKKEIETLKNNNADNTTASEPSPAPTKAPGEIIEYTDKIYVRAAQEALNSAGYNCGTPDGIAGPQTTQAITSYQTDKGLTVKGTVTNELLDSLGIAEQVQKQVEAEGAKNEYGSNYTYEQLARNPDSYIGQKIKFTGKVLQYQESDDVSFARVAMNSDYDTVIFVTIDESILGYRLLDDDIITVYGTSLGVYSYEAVSGATITIPWISADIIEMQ